MSSPWRSKLNTKIKQFTSSQWLFSSLFLLLFLLVTVVVFTTPTLAAPPSLITYEGRVMTPDGTAVTTTVAMKLVLYDDPTAGTKLYTAAGTLGSPTALTVSPTSSGAFSIELGGSGTNSLDPQIFKNNSSVYLEVSINGETLSPRKQVNSVPYAFNSLYLNGVGTDTVSSSQYIPLSDSSGNFNFNQVTTTFVSSTNGIAVSGSSTLGSTYISSLTVGSSPSLALLGNTQTFTGLKTFSVTTTLATTTINRAQLEVTNGSILASGTAGVTPASGAGTRLMWIPSKAAFRAGLINGTQWDAANIGTASVAIGENNIASGNYAAAIGYLNNASGYNSIALGTANLTSGTTAVAFGNENNATANNSVAIGNQNTASAIYAMALGYQTTVSGQRSVGINLGNSAASVSATGVMAILGGNVGIGTANPGYTLSVTGTLGVSATSTFTTTTIASSTIGDANIGNLVITGNCVGCASGAASLSSDNVFSGLNTFSSGFISNASSSIGGGLQVSEALNASGTLSIAGNTYFPGNGIWNTSGKLGVGTLNPGYNLSVTGTLGVSATSSFTTATFSGIVPTQTNNVALTVQGLSGQTADLQQWKLEDGTVIAQIAGTDPANTGNGVLTLWDKGLAAGNESVLALHTDDSSPFGIQLFNDTFSTTNPRFSTYVDNSGEFTQLTNGANTMNFATNGYTNIRMAISSAGKVIVGGGTGSHYDYGGTLQVRGLSQIHKSVAPASITFANSYLHLGGEEYQNNSFRAITFGYFANTTHVPAYLGFQERNSSGLTYGDLVFGTRNTFSDEAPSERLRITSAGNVGIGTTNPGFTLSVTGTLGVSATSTFTTSTFEEINLSSAKANGTNFFFENTDTGGKLWRLLNSGSANTGGAGSLLFVNSTDDPTNSKFTITSEGNVGVGTASPNFSKLMVNNDSSQENTVYLNSAASFSWIKFAEAGTARGYIGYGDNQIFSNSSADSFSIRAQGDLHLGGGGNNLTMTLTTGGKVGVGTTNPQQLLHLSSGVDRAYAEIQSSSGISYYGIDQDGNATIQAGTSGKNINFWNHNTQIGTILSSGKFGIGTTNPVTAIEAKGDWVTNKGQLFVNSTTNDYSGLSLGFSGVQTSLIYSNSDGGGSYSTVFNNNNNLGSTIFQMGTDNIERLRITNAGNIGIATTNPGFTLSASGTLGVASTSTFFATSTFTNASGLSGLQIFSTLTTTTLKSFATGDGAGAFVLDTNSAFTVASSSILLSLRNQGSPVFSVASDGGVRATGTIVSNADGTSIGDVAEYVNITPGTTVQPGDVVVTDEAGLGTFKASSGAYAKQVAGVISDTGRFVMGSSGKDRAALALSGLVKTNVTNENGAIKAGDYLVTATKPGFAMKYDENSTKSAGIVGMALEALDTPEGKITILVNKGFFTPTTGIGGSLQLSENNSGELVNTGTIDLHNQILVNIKSIAGSNGNWSIDEEGKLIAKSAKVKEILVQKDENSEKSTIGRAQIKAGERSVLIKNELVRTTTEIFITFRTDPKTTWWISKQESGQFEVSIHDPASENVDFSYWLIGVEEAPTAESSSNLEAAPVIPPEPSVVDPAPAETPSSTPVESPIETPSEVGEVVSSSSSSGI